MSELDDSRLHIKLSRSSYFNFQFVL